MKFIFSLIVIIHALIHIMGFVKAFQLVEINQLTQSISKPTGIIWLVSALLFLISLVLFVFKKEWWFIVALVAVVVSQVLIILFWKDAKFGTVANVIITLTSISAFGNYQFMKVVKKDSAQILQNIQVENLPIISKNDISHLPEIVQKWMHNSGVIKKEEIVSVYLKQIGKLRTKPTGKWMPFTANQYFNVQDPAFVWTTNVEAMPILKMTGRDKFYDGEGAMLIKLASLIPLVNEKNNVQINQGAMVRYLAEMCWFPSAALNDYVNWEEISATTAKGTLTINNKSVSGFFTFSTDGNLTSFEAERYYTDNDSSELEKWHIEILSYKVFNGITIPNKSTVTWKLKDGDFNWLDLEIIDLKFNVLYTKPEVN